MSTRAAGALSIIAVLISGLVWLPSLDGEYVYDDHRFVRLNPAVQDGVGLFEYFADPATQTVGESWEGLYRPMRTLSYRIVRLLGAGPCPQRGANLAIHLVNVVLVWVLLRRLFGAVGPLPPLVGALAFSIHPLGAESVAWVSSRGDLLAATGMLCALYCHSRRWGAGSALFMVFALLSKESAVVLPLLMVAVDCSLRGSRRLRERWAAYLMAGGVLLGYIVLRSAALPGDRFAQSGGLGLGGIQLTGALVTAFGYYLRDLLLPLWGTFDYTPPVTWLSIALGGGLILAAGVAAVAARRQARWLTLGILWIIVALTPVTLLQYGFPLKILMAGRFAYPAIIGCSLFLLGIVGRGRRYLVAAVLLLTFLIPLTLDRASSFRDERSLWSTALAVDPGNSRALAGLGAAELKAGDFEAACSHLKMATEIESSHPGLLAAYGRACWERANDEERESKEQLEFLIDSRDAYDRASRIWYEGSRQDRHLCKLAAVRSAWFGKRFHRPDIAHFHAVSAMNEKSGRLPAVFETLVMLRELAEFLSPEHPALGEALAAEASRLEREIGK